MGRLNLVVADRDEAYVESFLEFFSSNYSQRFRVCSFTSLESLNNYIIRSEDKIDILLISPELYSCSILKDKIDVLILLSTGGYTDIDAHGTIRKYQHGDKLAGEIINIYAKAGRNDIQAAGKGRNTKVIAVYSPIGGTGKTSIAVNSCIQCSQKGLSVFYLNLESIQSTHLYFECKKSPSLSDILYHVKEKSKSIGLRIEGARCIDAHYGIHYFSPPDSSTELEELLPDEIGGLIAHLVSMQQYDVVIIDMSSTFDSRIKALLKASDQILLVMTQDVISSIKLKCFENELNILNENNDQSIKQKINIVINKCDPAIAFNMDEVGINGRYAASKLPVVKGLEASGKPGLVLNGNSEFQSGINLLLEKLVK